MMQGLAQRCNRKCMQNDLDGKKKYFCVATQSKSFYKHFWSQHNTVQMWPDFEKPDLSRKMLFRVIHRFGLVTGILSILSFVDNHTEQSLGSLLVHIWSLYELWFYSYKCLYTNYRDILLCVIQTQYNV